MDSLYRADSFSLAIDDESGIDYGLQMLLRPVAK